MFAYFSLRMKCCLRKERHETTDKARTNHRYNDKQLCEYRTINNKPMWILFFFLLLFCFPSDKNNCHDTFNSHKPEDLSRILLQVTQILFKFTNEWLQYKRLLLKNH